MEKRLTRRVALSSLGLISGGILASGCTKGLVAPVSAEPVTPAANGNGLGASSEADHGWKYAPLNAEEIADRAYAMYPDGGCMYSMFGSVISALGERFGEPFSQFPYSMMRYGEGGVGKWGSLCGVVNGAAALIGLFYPEDQNTREKLIEAFAYWYESSELPVYVPKDAPQSMEIPKSVAGSILCHFSVGAWCKVSGYPAFCKEKTERCRRLTADGVRFLVTILNESHMQTNRELPTSPTAKACNDCHGKAQLADAMVKMNCQSCHDLDPSHSVQPVTNGTEFNPAQIRSGR
ncbi:MAG TPA: C-GCAxxG-C-C family (seleno)protein [Thermogutta sp.]|nr:C-GCAxxG-C-C family (seleno)protein [Thermogutta sp.]